MNLAEIRKKAQMERKGAEVDVPSPVSPAQPAQVQVDLPEIVHPEPVEVMSPLEPSAGPVTEVVIMDFPQEPAPAGIQSARTASFDPISQILAGRETSQEAVLTVEEESESTAERLEFLCFRVANEIYAVNILELKEIIKLRECTEVPRMPAYVSGVFSLRGVIVPVFDLHARLGLAAEERTSRQRIVVVKKGAGFCGLKVDEVLGVVKIAGNTVEQPPAVLDGIDRDFVGGIGRHDSWMIILLNLEKILDVHLA